ncbi:MAG TPA: hypothetical protein VFX18_02355 [Candidatus Nitrosocosmicus sp.]|nr:hypothetical protein [Candidatus Nitrosocosmicus sp.]
MDVIEPTKKEIIGMSISKEGEICLFVVTEHFLSDVVDEYGQHLVSADGVGTCIPPCLPFSKL